MAHNVTGDNPLVCRKREGGREQGMNKHMHGQRCEEGAHTHTHLLIQRNRFIRHLSLQPHAESLM